MNEGGVRWIKFADIPGWANTPQPCMRGVVTENRGTPLIRNIRIAVKLDRPARRDVREDFTVLASYCYTDEATIIELIYDFVVCRYGMRYVGFDENNWGKYDQRPAEWQHPEDSALDALRAFNAMIGVYHNKELGDPLDYILDEEVVIVQKIREKAYGDKGYGDWA